MKNKTPLSSPPVHSNRTNEDLNQYEEEDIQLHEEEGEEVDDEFGPRLDAFIETYYKTREEFMKVTGFSKQQLSGYCTGRKKPKYPQMVRIFRAGFSLDFGFGGVGAMSWRFLADAPADGRMPSGEDRLQKLDAWANQVIAFGESMVRLGREAKGE